MINFKTRFNSVKVETSIRLADRAIFRIGSSFELLDKLRWDPTIRETFLENWEKKKPKLPIVHYNKHSFQDKREELKAIEKKVDAQHPIGRLIKETSEQYRVALSMLEARGRKPFMRYSKQLYGMPTDSCGPNKISTLKAAESFLNSVGKFKIANIVPADDVCILAGYVADKIQKKANIVFKENTIQVITDPKLFSKAAASPQRIRVRSSTCFAPHDIKQLIEHELMVHILTIQNGRKQPYKCLGLNSPRTTCTQEGLAVFAEFITSSIDISRLHRISARVKAIQMAIDGANFIEIFKFFLDQEQNEFEAYNSAARIFRGGDVNGGVVFTKDLTYLKGFVEVHHFFLDAMQDENYLYPNYLFAGRMTTEDVSNLSALFESNNLKMPYYQPDWIKSRSTLLAFLVSSNVMNSLGMSKIT
jgi:uncharacterized protein (TIGR02421 family)